MLYELVLAQYLATLYGNTVLRYAVTIAIYVFAMGVGSMGYSSIHAKKVKNLFVRVETTLAILGIVIPVIGIAIGDSAFWLLHGVIIAVGFLSGYELPIINDQLSRKDTTFNTPILAIDYFAMCVASVAFPLFLFNRLGLFNCFIISAAFNVAAIGLWLCGESDAKQHVAKKWILPITLGILLLAICLVGYQDWLVGLYAAEV